MNQGWVKLYRKLLDNEVWHHDPTAWRVFEYFLLTVNRDTGKRTFGRFQVARFLDMNPNTFYSAIQRLKKAKMITLTSNNRYSTIYILKWGHYQSSSTQAVNNTATQPATLNKNKELRNRVGDYPTNTIEIAKIIGVEPSDGLDRYLNDTYKRYKFKSFTEHYVQWCSDKGKTPTISQWMNWVRADANKGLLETRDQ